MKIEGNDLRLAAATATQIQNTGAQQAVVAPKPPQQHETDKSSKGDSVQSLGGDKVSIKVDLPKNTVDALQKMGNISDFLNSVATNLRQTNEGLKAVSDVVEQMKASLDKIIKNYPPFLVQNRERMELLMSYSGLKKEIQSMMIPAPPSPVYESVRHLWDGLTAGQGNTVQTPTLPQDAPDSHVQLASQQLAALSDQIKLVQEAMGNSVKNS
jgi:hypothetical protein